MNKETGLIVVVRGFHYWNYFIRYFTKSDRVYRLGVDEFSKRFEFIGFM